MKHLLLMGSTPGQRRKFYQGFFWCFMMVFFFPLNHWGMAEEDFGKEGKKLKYPIVLAHGIARFDYLTQKILKSIEGTRFESQVELDEMHYFKGIATYLRSKGFKVYHSNVGFAERIEKRASDLGLEIIRIIQHSGKQRVHIIAHSMGGLDARYMIVHVPQMKSVIVSLTTIGTPHHGTSFADWACFFYFPVQR